MRAWALLGLALVVMAPVGASADEIQNFGRQLARFEKEAAWNNVSFGMLKEWYAVKREFERLERRKLLPQELKGRYVSLASKPWVVGHEKWGNTQSPEMPYMNKCYEQMTARKIEIEERLSDQCQGPNGKRKDYGNPVRYTLSKNTKNSLIQLTIPMNYLLDPLLSDEEKQAFQKRWVEASACAVSFWQRYGVQLVFEKQAGAQAAFTVTSGSDRGNAANLYLGSHYFTYLCSWIIHEYGHWMGLLDDYIEPGYTCPARRNDRKDSVMNLEGIGQVYKVNLYQEHLQKIFGRACGP